MREGAYQKDALPDGRRQFVAQDQRRVVHMPNHKGRRLNTGALIVIAAFTLASASLADDTSEIKLPGDRAYPESITAAPDRTLLREQSSAGWRVAYQPSIQKCRGMD